MSEFGYGIISLGRELDNETGRIEAMAKVALDHVESLSWPDEVKALARLRIEKEKQELIVLQKTE